MGSRPEWLERLRECADLSDCCIDTAADLRDGRVVARFWNVHCAEKIDIDGFVVGGTDWIQSLKNWCAIDRVVAPLLSAGGGSFRINKLAIARDAEDNEIGRVVSAILQYISGIKKGEGVSVSADDLRRRCEHVREEITVYVQVAEKYGGVSPAEVEADAAVPALLATISELELSLALSGDAQVTAEMVAEEAELKRLVRRMTRRLRVLEGERADAAELEEKLDSARRALRRQCAEVEPELEAVRGRIAAARATIGRCEAGELACQVLLRSIAK